MTAPPIQAPFIPEPRPRERRATRPVAHTGAPALEAAAFAMPAMPAFGPFEASPHPERRAQRSRSLADMLINGTERLASLVLFAAILIVIGGIVAAEVSPAANTFIASLIHVDVKVTIAHFLQQMQQLTQRK